MFTKINCKLESKTLVMMCVLSTIIIIVMHEHKNYHNTNSMIKLQTFFSADDLNGNTN